MPTVLLGSISTLADTSELQREAFNRAFTEHDLDWHWDRGDYQEMLNSNGGGDRISRYADTRGQSVDAGAVHETKSRIFRELLASSEVTTRPGVLDLVRAARTGDTRLGLVTTTSPENVAAILAALGHDLNRDDFDLVTDITDVRRPKPDPEVYTVALRRLGGQAADCVAVEDNVGGVRAAVDAGLTCVAFPNQNTASHDFTPADRVVDHLDATQLTTARTPSGHNP